VGDEAKARLEKVSIANPEYHEGFVPNYEKEIRSVGAGAIDARQSMFYAGACWLRITVIRFRTDDR
jgi:hypothetical protein